MSYDVKCLELAETFLDDLAPNIENKTDLCDELAEEIQQAIETFLSYKGLIDASPNDRARG